MTTATAKAEGSASKKLLQGLLTELALQSSRYNSMSQEGQEEVIERLRLQVEECVRVVACEAGSRALLVLCDPDAFMGDLDT